MRITSKALQWNRPLLKSTNNIWIVVAAGLALVMILGGLAVLNPLIGIAGALGILMLAVVVPRPVLIVYALVFLGPLIGGLSRGAVLPVLRVGQAVLVLGFVLFALAKPGRLGKTRLTYIDLAFALFFLTEAVLPVLALYYRGEQLDLNNSNNVYGVSPLQTMLGPLQYYLLYRIVVATISSERQMKRVLELSFVSCIIVSVIGILEQVLPAVKTFVETYYPPVANNAASDSLRISSTLQHFSGLAAYVTFNILVALVCFTNRKQIHISPLLLMATILFSSIALLLTGTLAGWIGMGVGMAVVFLLIRHIPRPVIFVLVGIALAAIIFQTYLSGRLQEELAVGAAQGVVPQSFAFRIMLWRDIFLPAIGQNLFFGGGPAPVALNSWSTEESQYFLMLLRGGLPYFLSYFLIIGVAIVHCWRSIRGKNGVASQPIGIALFAILVTISVMNVSGEYFTYVGPIQTLWTLLALVVASGQLKALEVKETSSAALQMLGNKWRAVSPPSQNPPVTAPTTPANGSVERHLLKEKKQGSAYSLIPDTMGPAMSRRDWRERLLDWSFVKDSVVVGAGSTMARVLGLLFATLLAHFLSPDNFGFFRYSVTLATIITIASSNSPVSIARFLATSPDPQARDRYFSNGLVGTALLLVASTLISLPILWLLHAFDLGTIACIVGFTGFYWYLAVMRGLSNAWKMSLTYILNNVALIVALFVVFGFFKFHTSTMALVIYGLANLVPLALELIRPMPLKFRLSLVSKDVLLELARFAAPIVVSSGAFATWFGIDQLLVQNFDPHASGSYAAAKTLAQAFIFVPSAITMILMPRVAAQGLDKSKRYVVGGVLMSIVVSLSGVVIVDVWGQKMIALIFGHNYSSAFLPLLVMSIGMSILSVYTILEGFVIGRGRPNLSTQALAVALVSTGAVGFWLTSWLGAVGASLAFTIGAALGTMVMLFNTWRVLRANKQEASRGISSAKRVAVKVQ